jgi:hypothetical protein
MRTELVSTSVGQPGKQNELVRIDEASLPRQATDERERLLGFGSDADFLRSLQDGEGAGFTGLQGKMRVDNAYRAIDRAQVADIQYRRKHRIDLLV